jgi:hypothetical protein
MDARRHPWYGAAMLRRIRDSNATPLTLILLSAVLSALVDSWAPFLIVAGYFFIIVASDSL